VSDYKGDHKSIYLCAIGDLHIGHKNFDESALNQTLEFIDKNRNRCRILLMGDLLECATKTSVGRGIYDESYPTQKQFEKIINIFKPYSDLIDGVVEGNHEERVIRDTSFEIMQEFCHRIDCFDKYSQFECIQNFHLGDFNYSSYIHHGSSGGITESAAITSLLKMRERAIVNAYFLGHTHKLLSFTRRIHVPSTGSEALEIEQLFVNTGTALGGGGYGTQKGYPELSTGFGCVEIFRDEKKMIFHKISDLR
jgi:hypothetical protein